jgi:hypothetical protein
MYEQNTLFFPRFLIICIFAIHIPSFVSVYFFDIYTKTVVFLSV